MKDFLYSYEEISYLMGLAIEIVLSVVLFFTFILFIAYKLCSKVRDKIDSFLRRW